MSEPTPSPNETNESWENNRISFSNLEARTKQPTKKRCCSECKLPFGAFLAIVVVIGVMLTCVVIAVPLYTSVQDGYSGLAKDVQTLTSTNVFNYMGSIAIIPIENIAILSLQLATEAAIDRFAISPYNPQLQRTMLTHTLTAFGGVVMGTPNKTFFGYRVTPTGLVFVNTTTAAVLTTDWYIGATQDNHTYWNSFGRVFWSDSKLIPGCRCLGVTASRPVYVGSELVAVVATHLPVSVISQSLNQSKIGTHGVAFLFDHNGIVAALSNPKKFNFTFDKLTHATEIEGKLMSDLLNYLGNDFSAISAFYRDDVYLDGQRYLLLTQHVAASPSLNWTGVVIFPWDDYFGAPNNALTVSLAIGVVMAVVLCALMIVSSVVLLTIPLQRLAIRMGQTMNSPTNPKARSRRTSIIHEVASMETSYDHMIIGLNGFSKYVPSPVVMDLVKSAQEPQAVVQTRVCTFLFSDIVSFTAAVENVPAGQLHIQLSEYFDAMELILSELRGITTDYLGDGLFVFWNAPTPEKDHALLACEAALRQHAKLAELRESWKLRGLPQFHIRIGINTGMCLVGSFGSQRHLKYTAMGDAVNTASRLEQLNKYYKTDTIIGESTYEQVKNQYLARPIDIVVVVGKTKPLTVYSLLCAKCDATPELIQFAHLSEQLLLAFMSGDVESTKGLAYSILAIVPDDIPTLLLLRRCDDDTLSHARVADQK